MFTIYILRWDAFSQFYISFKKKKKIFIEQHKKRGGADKNIANEVPFIQESGKETF